MALISDEYRALLAQKHAASGQFGTSGDKWALHVHKLALQNEARTILDYGCGKGTLGDALEKYKPLPYEFRGYDPAVPGKEQKPVRSDLVICGDVLEHIEPDCLEDVLDDIRNIARIGVFLVVATKPASKHLPDGRNTHLIVKPSLWWIPKILDRWELRHFKDYGGEFMAIGQTMP